MEEEKTLEEVKLAVPVLPFAATISKSHATMKDRVTFYKLQAACSLTGEESNFVVRFSDVAELYDKLESVLPLANQLPPFPPRTAKDLNANHLQPEFVDRRVEDVNRWFLRLVGVPDILTVPELFLWLKMEDAAAAAKKKAAEKKQQGVEPEQEFTVSVPEAALLEDESACFYTVQLTNPSSGAVKTFQRRFNDFKTLNTQLLSDYGRNSKHLAMNIPTFPQSKFKLFTNHSDPAFIEARRQTLDNYMQKVVELPHALSDIHLKEFFGLWNGW